MKVLLMDLDIIKQRRPFPNLALMKLSAYHRARGDQVFLNFPLQPVDIAHASCVFTWNARRRNGLSPDIIVGGSGVDLKAELPLEVEHIMPDYSLYPNVDYSLGFTSRGCIRRCPWCSVPEKEGGIRPVARIYEFWNRQHRKILLLDNNLLAAASWRQTMEDLIVEGLEVDFYQGLDIRLVSEETVDYLKRVKAKKLRFAFDDIAYQKAFRRGIELLLENGLGSRKLEIYVLYGFGDDDTDVERMVILHDYNVDVYPMLYKGPDGKEPGRRIMKIPDIMWHGPRRNISKWLRFHGRLPE
ncbi:hypothetical protein ES703_11509 [subsurface metagenome]